jgi:hypothetical protein
MTGGGEPDLDEDQRKWLNQVEVPVGCDELQETMSAPFFVDHESQTSSIALATVAIQTDTDCDLRTEMSGEDF